MSEHDDALDAYVPGHLLEALASDERVGEQDLQVDVLGHRVVISGTVASEERRAAVEVVARELLPEWDVRNQVDVVHYGGPVEREQLP
jgi:osmotically-inducible protein OsmY